jgi:hypothetical protein
MNINSAPYASYEERADWMAKVAARASREMRLPHPLLVEFKLSRQEVMDLQYLAVEFITYSMGLSPNTTIPDLLNQLEQTVPFKHDRKAHHFLIQLESRISQILHEMAFHQSIFALEYPVNTRIVHGMPIESYAKKKYATTNIHSDIWAGEPADTVQLLIPLMGNVRSNICQWYETNPENFGLYLSNLSSYKDAQHALGPERLIAHTFEVGTMYCFDSALPHQTIQKAGGVRISLDLRLRRLFPYADPMWLSRMNRERGPYDKYFLFPPNPYPYADFQHKLMNEIAVLDRLGLTGFSSLRRAALR